MGVVSVAEYVRDNYLPSRLDMRRGSAKQLELAAKQFDTFAGKSVWELSDDLLSRFLRNLLDGGLAESTVVTKRQQLLTVWRHAWKKGRAEQQPRDVPRPHVPERIPRAWTTAQMAAIVRECRGKSGFVAGIPAAAWWSSLALAAYWTGARISALLSTRTADCDLEQGCLIIRAQSQKQRTDQFWWLSPQAVESIREHYSGKRLLVWPHAWHPQTVWKKFRKIVTAAGVPVGKGHCELFYRIRRTSISYAAAVDLELARRQAGHKTSATTLKHYVDPFVVRARSAADVLPRLEF